MQFVADGTAVKFGPQAVLAPPEIATQNAVKPDPQHPGAFIPERWMIPPGDDQAPDPSETQAANDIMNCAMKLSGLNKNAIAPPGCSLVDITTPAAVQLTPGQICETGDGVFSGSVTLSAQNMNSALSGTVTIDGVAKPFSAAVGHLTYKAPVSFVAPNQTQTKSISVKVTDANGRTASQTTQIKVPVIPHGCNADVSCGGSVTFVCGIEGAPIVLERWDATHSKWVTVASDPGNDPIFAPILSDPTAPVFGATIDYRVCVQSGASSCDTACTSVLVVTEPPHDECTVGCPNGTCGPTCGVPGKPPCHVVKWPPPGL
jgi:hypothetical protein